MLFDNSREQTPAARTASTLDILSAIPEPICWDWIRRDHPCEHALISRLASRFTPSELPEVIRRLGHCKTATEIQNQIRQRLAFKIHQKGIR
jgi:hypothetical protein